MEILKHINTDHQVVAAITGNGALEVVKKMVEHVTPMLAPLLVAAQIVVAIATAIWIFRQARGAQLANRELEHKIAREDKEDKSK
jgi:hypothetical protein